MRKVPILGWIMIASCVITLVLIPSRKELDQTKDELATVKNELKAKQKVVEQNFPLSGDFDLVKAEGEAQKRLTEAFSIVYGGLHSKEDLEKNNKMLQNYLGTDLAKEALLDSYNQDQYFLERNIQTQFGIKNVTDKHDCEILVVVTYQMKIDGKTYGKAYTLNYDLENQKVLSYKYDSMRVVNTDENK
ncbi:hypothetical protein [Ligilactobacillus murinus]|uniref:Uncharacterized protein n=1 Tax=Ligilactobacillus murinus TaxID=1622 RepID=A0AAE7BQH6_9LACO|nr:hypothetical protein [Ligilactobacillus murinus]MBF0758280.1 hypothetical protein [Ligilactobacillus murinus]MBF0831253.1 hypothetical protein [Ligilactobacillus murinus]NEF84512.1 hypothetical protein [Ligilactobacillus murinus]NEF86859.1 hypothetical protein [Ligilactobacillus murinus]NEF89148.1 hypothetical protein [Ligilactobacillus murinus]